MCFGKTIAATSVDYQNERTYVRIAKHERTHLITSWLLQHCNLNSRIPCSKLFLLAPADAFDIARQRDILQC